MRISIFGMGYVGSVTAACLLKQGHWVIGVDVVEDKLSSLRQGKWPIFENGLDALVPRKVMLNSLNVTTNSLNAILETDMSIICVGTPGLPDGRVDLRYLSRTIEQVNRALTQKKGNHIVLIRSTVPPGTTESVLLPILQRSLQKDSLTVGFYPEFLREGSAIKDFFNPSLNVLGCASDFPVTMIDELLPEVNKKVQLTSIKTAEALKYANNTFHALKIVFVNELASICNQCDVKMEEVMDIFCQDKVLNISPYYLKPGFAFGGSCLPKEVKAIIAMAKDKRIDAPLFEGILKSNDEMIERFVSIVHEMNFSSVGYFGITFKPETDDIRESPVLRAIEMLLSKTTSYSQRIKQVVFDGDRAIAKVRDKFGEGFVIAKTPEELIKLSDAIVLGPYEIDENIQSEIILSNKSVIDLKWHEVGTKLLQYPKYLSMH